MQNDAADDLHREMPHAEHTRRRLAAGRKRLGQDVVERLAVLQAFLQNRRLVFQFLCGHGTVGLVERQNLIAKRPHAL